MSNTAYIQPGSAAERKMFYRNDEAGNQCIGYLRGDFGKCGDEFWHQWFDQDNDRNTLAFKAEFKSVMETLRHGILRDRKSCFAYCLCNPEALIPGSEGNRYGFKMETESRQYFIRCTTLENDYFYVYA